MSLVSQLSITPSPQAVKIDKSALSKDYRSSEGQGNQLFTRVMTFMMGIVTMVCMTNNMPRELTDATLYSSSMHDADSTKTNRAISSADFLSMIKRINALEEQGNFLSEKTTPEKEEMLIAAWNSADRLEQELSEMRKSLEDILARQDEFLAYIDKKKKFFAF